MRTVDPGLARFLKNVEERRSAAASAKEDAEGLQGLSREQRAQQVESACRMAWEILRSRQDFARALEFQEPRSPESERLWLQLVRRFRSSAH